MAAFLQLAGISGEATDKLHKDWIVTESMMAPILRTIPKGARDHQRLRGSTVVGDVFVTRELDKSSVKLQQSCANGTFFPDATIHFTTQVSNRQQTYLEYVLTDVILSGYDIQAYAPGDPTPLEHFTMNYTTARWMYLVVDSETGQLKGRVPGEYSPGQGASG